MSPSPAGEDVIGDGMGDGAKERGERGRLVLSGLRWRFRGSLAMFVVAVFAAGIAAFGPIYLNSTNQTILNSTLASAPAANKGLTLETSLERDVPTRLEAATAAVPRPAHGRWFGEPIITDLAAYTAHVGSQPYGGSLVARTGVCRHLLITTGRCSTAASTVLLSTRSAHLLGLSVGQRLSAQLASGRVASLVVSGVYEPGSPAAPFWWGQNFFSYGTGPHTKPNLDAAFVTPSSIARATGMKKLSSFVQVPFAAGSLPVGAVPSFQAALGRYEAGVQARDGIHASSQLPSLFARAAGTERTSGTIVEVIDLELALLAIFVLYFVASRTASEREPDVRLASLRGFRPRSVLAVAMAEPVVLVTVAVPIGLLMAWAVVGASASAIFGPGVGGSITVLAVAAAVVAGIGGIVATGLGVRQVLSAGPEATADGTTAVGRTSVWRVVGDVAVVAVAAAAFFELAAAGVNGRSGAGAEALSALAPALAALAAGVLGARVLPLVLRATHRRSEGSKKVTLAFATRRVGRLREFAALIVLVAVAVGLATFAVSGWAVAGRNRQVRAEVQVGAPTVLTVVVPQGATFLELVHRADPGGRAAMAAVLERASDGTTLAVDARSMTSVMAWPPDLGIPVGTVARRLVPTGLAPAVVVHGTTVMVTADTAAIHGSAIPSLSLSLYNQRDQAGVELTLGRVVLGNHTYRASLTGSCPGGCRLQALDLSGVSATGSTAGVTGTVTMAVTALQSVQRGRTVIVAAGLSDPRRWRGSRGALVGRAAVGGLSVRAHVDALGTPAAVSPADVPVALPTAVTPATASSASGHGGPILVGLDGTEVPGHTVAQVPDIPGVGANATLVDLPVAERFLTSSILSDTTEVWLSATAPPSIVGALTHEGVSVVGRGTIAAAGAALGRSGVSLAYLLFLIAGIASVALAVGATAFALAAAARRHRSELFALRAVGIPLRFLRRFLWAEQSLALSTGVVLGAVVGLVAAAVAVRSIPEFTSQTSGPPLELELAPVAAAVTIVVVMVALACTVVGGAWAVAQGAELAVAGPGPGPGLRGDRGAHDARGAPRSRPVMPAPTSARAALLPAASGGARGADVRMAGVVHLYHQAGADVVGLRSVDLDVEPGEMVALLGPSGMGKTTVLRLMAGLMVASAGSVKVGAKELGQLSPGDRRKLRAGEVSYVVQDTVANVLPFATVKENLWFSQHGARTSGHQPPWTPASLLDYLGLAGLCDARVATLSMGAQQQVAIAAGVAAGPRLLLADEPTGQLTADATDGVIGLLRRVNASGTTVVIVTHDPEVAAQFPRAITIRDGRVGAEARDGEEYAVIDRSGSVQLPPEALHRLGRGTPVRVLYAEDGVVLQRPDPSGRARPDAGSPA